MLLGETCDARSCVGFLLGLTAADFKDLEAVQYRYKCAISVHSRHRQQ